MTRKEWKKLDNKISRVSKEDKDYTCETCGRCKYDGWQIHHHHFISRTCTALRWVLENIFVLCARCHRRFEGDPQWAIKTAIGLRGDKWNKLIEKIKRKTNKKTLGENEALMEEPLETILKSYK